MNHQWWLLKTLVLAKQREGFCAPNPAVGAVVVKDNQLISMGYHWGAGFSHAEVGALNSAGQQAKGADLYVSLEPCCHYGRTPPCVDKIIASGIKRVFFGFLDPNPKVAGQGQRKLLASGIICKHVSVAEIDEFYHAYAYWTMYKKPWITAKIAATADGYIAKADGSPVAITGDACRELTHEYRKKTDAILTTARTVLNDDPLLNVRLSEQVISKPLYVLDTHLNCPLNAKIFKSGADVTVFISDQCLPARRDQLSDMGIRYIIVPVEYGRLSLKAVVAQVAADGMQTLWVEAGGQCFSSFFEQGLLHRAIYYRSPDDLTLPGLPTTVPFSKLQQQSVTQKVEQYGRDTVFTYYFY